MVGLLRGGRGKAALIALAIGLFTLSPAPTVAPRPATPPLTGYAGLRPDWVRLPIPTPAPAPAVSQAPVTATARPEPPPSPPSPTVEAPSPAEPPATAESIVIAAVSPSAEAPPSATIVESPSASPEAPPTPSVAEGPDPAFAQAILDLTNQARAANGLAPLAPNPALVAAAEGYADLHSHLSPDRLDHYLNGSTLDSRAEAQGYTGWTFLAENLVWSGFDPGLSPEEVVQDWLDSPGHRDNMLSPSVNETGVGCYVRAGDKPFRICVQDFGARP